ncbi:MAG: hypothetical protein PWQ28_200 [Candidatus Woesearchaeota archaeon]|nr:hypothetical protein [Candidatus Woesearchaeota archaeon]
MVENLERILVTGAAGQIGSELVPALCEKYNSEIVIASVLNKEEKGYVKKNYSSDKQRIEYLDVRDKENLEKIIRRYNINTIYHLAGILSANAEKNQDLAWEVNINGLKNVLDLAAKYKIKVFWPSSIAAFGNDTPKENTPQNTLMTPTTIYGISKRTGELLCNYYAETGKKVNGKIRKVDVRSVRYPGIISYKTPPGGGTTDYAVQIFYDAIEKGKFECFVKPETILPMMYMPDSIKAAIDIMDAPSERIKERTSYNIASMSFSAKELEEIVKEILGDFEIEYKPDYRQAIADSWPHSIDDNRAREDWGWNPRYSLREMCEDMVYHLKEGLRKKEKYEKRAYKRNPHKEKYSTNFRKA